MVGIPNTNESLQELYEWWEYVYINITSYLSSMMTFNWWTCEHPCWNGMASFSWSKFLKSTSMIISYLFFYIHMPNLAHNSWAHEFHPKSWARLFWCHFDTKGHIFHNIGHFSVILSILSWYGGWQQINLIAFQCTMMAPYSHALKVSNDE